MTQITIIDRPCGYGKSTQLIEDIKSQLAQDSSKRYLIVLTTLGEVERFEDELSPLGFISPQSGTFTSNKVEDLESSLLANENIITTHSMYDNINKFSESLSEYDIYIDETVNVAKKVDTGISAGLWDIVIKERGFLEVDPVTLRVSATQAWTDQKENFNGHDTAGIRKFMSKVEHKDLVLLNEKYFIMPIPRVFFTAPKSITILTFLFEGSLLASYMKVINTEYVTESDPKELAQFKVDMKKNLIILQKSSNTRCSYNNLSGVNDTKRKSVINWIKNTIPKILKEHRLTTEDVLTACYKDAFYGTSENKQSKVSNLSKLSRNSRLKKSEWTAPITRGTNKFSHLKAVLYLNSEFLSPEISRFLEVDTKSKVDAYALSELIQLIYRSAIRNNEKVVFMTPDKRTLELLNNFLDS